MAEQAQDPREDDLAPERSTSPAAGAPRPRALVERPVAMDRAVLAMRLGAVLSVVSVVPALLFPDRMRAAAEQALRATGQAVTTEAVDDRVGTAMAAGVLTGVVGAVLWLVMASANGAGRRWARWVATGLLVISVLSVLLALGQATTLLDRTLGLANVGLGAVAVALLWRPESSDYYRAMSGPGL